MWNAIISFLGGPVISGLLEAYKTKLQAGVSDTKLATDLAAAQIAADTQTRVAEIGHPWEPEKLAFYVVLIYFAKCVLWDTTFGFGTTGALKGNVSSWAGMVMGFYFGKRTFENVARILKR